MDVVETDSGRSDAGTPVFRLQQRLEFLQSSSNDESLSTAMQGAGRRWLLPCVEPSHALYFDWTAHSSGRHSRFLCRGPSQASKLVGVWRRPVRRTAGLLDGGDRVDVVGLELSKHVDIRDGRGTVQLRRSASESTTASTTTSWLAVYTYQFVSSENGKFQGSQELKSVTPS